MRGRRAGYRVAVVITVSLAGWYGAAFACTPTAGVYTVASGTATAGSTIEVAGRDIPSNAPVEIRWNGVRGNVMAAATPANGAFSVPVRIPEVAPGVYALTMITANAGIGRTAVEVMPRGLTPALNAVPTWASGSSRSSDPEPASNSVGSNGVVLLAVGLVGLFAGSTVMVVRRRRVPAGTPQ
jgi:hypothetical protein